MRHAISVCRPARTGVRRWSSPLLKIVPVALLALTASCSNEGPDETQRLAGLCEVWGFLKYFHPQVAQREGWDDALIAAVPGFKAAESKEAFNREVVALINEAGEAPARPAVGFALSPALQWIDNRTLFEDETSTRLRGIVAGWYSRARSVYVGPAWQGGNAPADFSGDQGHSSAPQFPDEPTRLLALFRFWNMVQYYFPDKDIMDRDWFDVLHDMIPRFVNAADALEYHLAVAELASSLDDGHAFAYSSVLAGHFGLKRVPLDLRLVEERTVITLVFPRLYDGAFDLHVGDVVAEIDGDSPETRRATLREVLPGSNEVTLERNVHDALQRSNADRAMLTVEGDGGQTSTWSVNTVALDAPWNDILANHGPATEILPGNIGYINMHWPWMQVSDVEPAMERVRGTNGLVLDIRNYPGGTLYAFCNYLNPEARPFAKFTSPNFNHPGRFVWSPLFYAGPGSPNARYGTPPATYTYTGKVAVLVNEETISQAEYTVMALKTAPDVVVVGSQTAGADGDVTGVGLPGEISTRFTGLGVFYPDGTPTQRVGIVPDVVVHRTIQGLRAGRDEVLEAALELLR